MAAPRRGHRWISWSDEFQTYLSLHGELSPDRKRSLLLHCAGTDVQRWHKTLSIVPIEDEDSYSALLRAMSDAFTPTESVLYERFCLSETKQAIGEPMDDYLTRLRGQAKFCKFLCSGCKASYEDDVVLGTIVKNTSSPKLRQAVFERKILKLDDVIQLGRALESAEAHSREFTSDRMAMISEYKGPKGARRPQRKLSPKPAESKPSSLKPSLLCKFCATYHILRKKFCPAVGKTCSKCSRMNHFASCCKDGSSNLVTCDSSVYPGVSPTKRPFVPLLCNGKSVLFLLDLGANVNIVPRSLCDPAMIRGPKGHITAFGGNKVKSHGVTSFPVSLKDRRIVLECLVTDEKQPILGSQACLDLGLVSLNSPSYLCNSVSKEIGDLTSINKQFREIFSDDASHISSLPEVSVHVKEDASPRYIRSRPVPLALRDQVIQELNNMIDRGTLKKVSSSEWASPIVTVIKPNGKVRVCADFTQTLSPVVNKQLYPLPHPEELFAGLNGSRIFTKLDFRHCYEQYRLDAQAKALLTINTPIGLLRYNVLPYGLATAPAIVQAAQEKLFGDIPNVKIYIDDLLVFSSSMEEHMATLKQVYSRIREAGARLNKDKCIFASPELTYLGFKVSEQGRSLDPELVRPLLEFPTPSSPSEVKSFLGLVNFYGHFVKDLAAMAYPLTELTKDRAEFKWQDDERNSFAAIKKSVTDAPCLTHYDPSLPLILTTDASPLGLGAVLSQVDQSNERPVAFASRKLSKAERNYSQIDREATGIMYGLSKFERYLLGRPFAIKTDHRPLQYIFSPDKELPAVVSARLTRFAMRLSSFQYKILHVKGTSLSHADAFSRGPTDEPPKHEDPTSALMCNVIAASCTPPSSLIHAMDEDQELLQVMEAARTGSWGEISRKEFLSKRNSFSIKDNLLFWGIRLVVPSPLRSKFLEELHLTHRGMVKMKALARCKVWWPRIDSDISDFVSACVTCQTNAAAPPSEFTPHSPVDVWERIHVDYAQINKKDVLIIMDAGSKWIEAAVMKSTSTQATLNQLLYWFSRFGFPLSVHSDNGPQFANAHFKAKLREWGTSLSLSPPYHPQSNGQAERAVRIVKELSKKNPHLSLDELLFSYRATPLVSGKTPAELLLSRPLRTRLDGLLHCHSLPKNKLSGDTLVWCRNFQPKGPRWVPGKICEPIGKVLWKVQIGADVRTRHVNQLRPRRS
eukprot:TRINITY_DN2783_c0_g1_i6.p1 TRINITY_DN2783_c0_g1~~TRINITY_DN2783_c0_g1_i6.p1  ORF type:complete len:1211 (-),score=137.53 TRINITY_DN2783_c0_g1_i6:1226-4822(-)